jgi:pyruvate/2-oxoglutarate dehydrogenase complex dihydrolipoamide acyltransferase (E2) component
MMTFDHRVVDGADAARFMNVVKEALQNPANLLLMM